MLTSIDNSKVFNRLDFGHCLKSLARKGACRELLNIISSFLSNRVMRVKIGQVLSDPKRVMGGVPQGSLLGVFLFNIAIDKFKAFSGDVAHYGQVGLDDLPEEVGPQLVEVPREPGNRDYLFNPRKHLHSALQSIL